MNPVRTLWLCYGGMICVAIGPNLLPVYLTTFSAEFGGLGEEALGRIPALAFAGLVLGIVVTGPLADRMGARPFVLGGFGCSALGLALLSAAPGYGAVLAASVITGIGAGSLDMVMSPIVSAILPEKRSSALNHLHAFYCVGAVGTVVLASTALHFGIGWRSVALASAAVPFVLMLAFARVWLPPLVHPELTRRGLRSLMRYPRFHIALVGIALAGATEAGMAVWLPAFAERVLGYSKAAGGVALAAFSLAMVAGRMAAPHGLNRLNPYALIAFSGFAASGLFLLGAFSSSPALGLAACIFVGLACSVLWPTQLGLTADRIPEGGASMFGLMGGMGNVGCLLVPWLMGIVAERGGLRAAMASGALCPALIVAVAGIIWLADRRAGATASNPKTFA